MPTRPERCRPPCSSCTGATATKDGLSLSRFVQARDPIDMPLLLRLRLLLHSLVNRLHILSTRPGLCNGTVSFWSGRWRLIKSDYPLFMSPDAHFFKLCFPFWTGWKVICRPICIDSAICMGLDRGSLGGSLPNLPLSSPPFFFSKHNNHDTLSNALRFYYLGASTAHISGDIGSYLS